ncbi:MAG: helix-turn-helix domain-containing protein [Jatrophihabitantaceae bacterium]
MIAASLPQSPHLDARHTAEATVVDDERLTLGVLLHERMMRSGAAVEQLDPELAQRTIAWCLPWERALASNDALTDVLVYATAEQLDAKALHTLARRRAVAVVAAGVEATSLDGDLPIFAVAERISYRDVNHLVASLVLSRETQALRYGISVHRALVELLYRGAGLDALCHQMSRMSGCTTAILDPQFRVLAFEQSRDRVLEPAAVAAAFRDVGPTTPEDDEVNARPRVCPLDIVGAPSTAVVNAILLAGRHDGWVLVIEPSSDPHPHDIAQHRVIVDQGATIVGTELLRMRSVEEAEERARGDFVHALLHGRFTTQHDLEARAAHYDVPVGASYGVIVAGHLSAADGTESLNALFQLARDAARLAPIPGIRTLTTVVGNVLAVIRQVDCGPATDSPDAASKALADYARTLETELSRRIRHPVAVAYGTPVTGAERITDSYREARLALGLHHRLGMSASCGFQELRVYAILSELASSDQARDFTRDMLAPLRAQRHAGTDLEQSVMTYIQAGGNLNAAARELHIHRNTMLYKLERASRILQLDLRQAENQFAVWLAYKLDVLAETTVAVDRDLDPA